VVPKPEITNYNIQIPTKFQITITKFQTKAKVDTWFLLPFFKVIDLVCYLSFVHWNLFEICLLEFVIWQSYNCTSLCLVF